jgi:ATP phosphoribosyltransferase regulatory subunit
VREALIMLPELYGGNEVLRLAQRRLPALPAIRGALRSLDALRRRFEGTTVRFDLAELRGYHYHSGVVFAAYAQEWPNALALGGRYDEVGKAFGRARAATGFSMDLRELAAVSPQRGRSRAISVPYRPHDVQLNRRVAVLRARGEVVIDDLPGHKVAEVESACDRKLVRRQGRWVIEKLKRK